MTGHARPTTTLERRYHGSLDEVWALWTTVAGIESWWGPEGFTVTVRSLDLRPGGALLYAMSASAPEQVAFMESVGMPITTEATISYTEVDPPIRLGYQHAVDFIPGVEPYEVATVVELRADGDHVRLVLTLETMHADEWTQRAAAGWESELGKLEQAIARRRSKPSA